MKIHILGLLLITSCSVELSNKEPAISSHSSCDKIAKMLEGNYAYNPVSNEPCVVYIEQGSYYFYNDYQESGISLGLAMAVNRPKLKDFYKCTDFKGANKDLTSEQALLIDRNCRKKLKMKDTY